MCKSEMPVYNFSQLFCFYSSFPLVLIKQKKQTINQEVDNSPLFLSFPSPPYSLSGSNKDVCPVLHSLRYPKDPENQFHHEA